MASGIYCFENKINGCKYIGQSVDIQARYRHHLRQLKRGKDGCTYFQNAWTLYKKENFDFYIIEKCAIEEMDDREVFYIKELHSHRSENGYNIHWGGKNGARGVPRYDMRGGNNPLFGVTGSDHPAFGHVVTQEDREAMSVRMTGEGNHQFGKERTPEHCQKISEGQYSEKNWRFGKKNANASSPYFGVARSKDRYGNIKWRVEFWVKGKKVDLGRFKIEEEAAKAYDMYVLSNGLPNPLNFFDDNYMMWIERG